MTKTYMIGMTNNLLLQTLLLYIIFCCVNSEKPWGTCSASRPCKRKFVVQKMNMQTTLVDERIICSCPYPSVCPDGWSLQDFVISAIAKYKTAVPEFQITRYFMFCKSINNLPLCGSAQDPALRLSVIGPQLSSWMHMCRCSDSTPLVLQASYLFDDTRVEYYICDGFMPMCSPDNHCVMIAGTYSSYNCKCVPPLTCRRRPSPITEDKEYIYCENI